MALLISSVTITTSIATGQAARILSMSRPFAKVNNKCGGIAKLSLDIRADLVFAARANLCRNACTLVE